MSRKKFKLRYYSVDGKRHMLFVHDYESGFFQIFDGYNNKWVTSINSFMQVEHDYDTDFIEISEEEAMKISNGVSCEEEFQEYLLDFGLIKRPKG